MSARQEALVVATACLVAFLTGLGDLPFYTRGEPREGLVVREMLASGDWLVPARPEGELARKPPLFYWLAATATAALPARAEMALRLPSALLGTAGVLIVWYTARMVWGATAGLPAALILATSFEWTRASVSARVDMTLAGPLTLALAAWLLVLHDPRRRRTALAATAVALAMLAKGPVGLILPALAAGALIVVRREPALLRTLRVVPVLAIAAAVAALWYAAAFAEHGWAFYQVVAKENWLRFVDTDEVRAGHAHGPSYLPLLGLVGLLPWTPLLPLVARPLRRDAPARMPALLAACWSGAVIVFFSVADAKRSVYLLPMLPAVALLLAAGTTDPPRDGRLARILRITTSLYAPALALLALAAGALAAGVDVAALLRPWLKERDAIGAVVVVSAAQAAAPVVWLLAFATAIAAGAVHQAARARAWRPMVLVIGALAVVWTAAFDGLIHPAIGRTRSAKAFMARVDAMLPPGEPLYAVFPVDPGVRFYAPRPLRPWPAGGVDETVSLILWEDEWAAWRDRGGRPLAPIGVSGAREAKRGSLGLVVAPPGTTRARRASRDD